MKFGIKKGFTFAELMISLVVIAIITAILYPTISELAPNNNKQLFKATYKTIELVISDINDTEKTPADVFGDAEELCKNFAERLNVSSVSCAKHHLQTTNGVRWAFGDGVIIVDVNASNNNTKSSQVSSAGVEVSDVPSDWGNGVFTGNSITTDTFEIKLENTGRITSIGIIGKQHLMDVESN